MNSILIVDDEKENLKTLERLLRNDYELVLESSPFEALKRSQQNEFAVIVSDQRMPEMTGVELLEKVKQITPNTTRILLTGYTDMDAVVGAINRGHIYQYIAKPWDPEDLKIILKQANEAYNLKSELEQKNRALTKSNAELKKALDNLRLLDHAKARFLSLISHELNTPLTVLTSYVGLLKESKDKFSEETKTSIKALELATKRYSSIIDEVLLFVKLEAERSFKSDPFLLKKETEKILEELKPTIKERQLNIDMNVPNEISVLCDPTKMRTALSKFLNDCVIHTPPQETVKITIERTNSDVRYTVRRTGPTLQDDTFASLTPHGKAMHHRRGLGLALAMCKTVVESHGGQMLLGSNDDEGTEISLHFPS